MKELRNCWADGAAAVGQSLQDPAWQRLWAVDRDSQERADKDTFGLCVGNRTSFVCSSVVGRVSVYVAVAGWA